MNNAHPGLPATRLYFQHVTKCGGTSLRAALMQALRAADAHPASFYQLEPVKTNSYAKLVGLDAIVVRDLLLADRLGKPDCRFIAGHFRFTHALHAELMNTVISLTVLRDPVERFLSLYYYNYYKSADHGRETLALEEYITRDKARRSAEDYIRLFRGNGTDSRAFATESDIESACENLSRFTVVGCLEHMPLFIDTLSQYSGLNISMPTLNQSPAPASVRYGELPAELLHDIVRLCAPARVVYQHALQLAGVNGAEEAPGNPSDVLSPR